ncbi:RNase A-like domain-containing protein [Streptomyces sp. NPDC126522]|uniref:RNase A-like domain-containing protein n=1 Tax=Streptomyces sp. NPDC126522 TaxID=3155211 RepID=UPI00333136BE
MDRQAADKAVEIYQQAFSDAGTKLLELDWELDEALRSAPTFDAEEARAEAFGARALNDFKKEHKWTVPNDSAANHKYPLDLANQEYIDNSHGVDKHIGKTDDQLVQRLRDQSNIPAASTFKNMADAQKFTQLTIDKNQGPIRDYLNSGPPYQPASRTFTYRDSQGPVTGSSITKDEYQQALGSNRDPNVVQSHGVQIRVKPAPGMDPPFTLITSTPTDT